MIPLALDSALNLSWAAIATAALVWLALCETRVSFRRLVAVLIVTAALFPCVSASDDLFSFSLFHVHSGKLGGVGAPSPRGSTQEPSLLLVRLLQSLEHWQLPGACTPAPALDFIAPVYCSGTRPAIRVPHRAIGRAPPAWL